MLAGSPMTSGPMQQLLMQMNIPLTMVFAFLAIRGTRYSSGQYMGAGAIIIGVVVALYPALTGQSSVANSVKYNFVFLAAMAPTSYCRLRSAPPPPRRTDASVCRFLRPMRTAVVSWCIIVFPSHPGCVA